MRSRAMDRVTLGADKGYDTKDHVAKLRERNVTPHVAQKKHTAIDGAQRGTPDTK